MSVLVLDRIIELYLVPYLVCNQLSDSKFIQHILYVVILFATLLSVVGIEMEDYTAAATTFQL